MRPTRAARFVLRTWFVVVRHVSLPVSLREAVGLFLVSSLVRSLGVAAALVLAHHVGTGLPMDHYMTFSLVVSTSCALVCSPLPLAVSKRLARGDIEAPAVTRAWARRIAMGAGLCYALLCPVLAALLRPRGAYDGFTELLLLLLLGLPAVVVAAPVATEQAIVQSRGRPFLGVWSSGLFTASGLIAALASGAFGGVYLCAVGTAAGAWLEFVWLRRCNRGVAASPAAPEPLPWASLLTVFGASAGVLLQGFYDQALLARMGAGAQATWGLATRAPSFLGLSLFSVGAVLCTAHLSRALTNGRLHTETRRLFLLVFGLSALVLGIAGTWAEPVTRLLYERGAFGAADTVRVADTLRWAVFAYLCYPATGVLIRAAGLAGGHRLLLGSAAGFVVVKVCLASALVPGHGMKAMALATFAAGVAQVGLLVFGLRRLISSKM